MVFNREEAAREKMRAGEIVHKLLTRCVNCGHGHTYSRECMNRVMRCTVCQKSYVACNKGDEPSSSTKRQRGSVEEELVKNVSEVDGFDAAESERTKRDKRMKHKAEEDCAPAQLQKRMDELEKRIDEYTLKQHEGFMHADIKKKTHVVKPESSDIMKVQELAVVWKEKISSRRPITLSNEVLDFLHFIGVYRSQINSSIINQEETAQLASRIAHYKQAPTLIQSLGLNHFVPEYVEKLIKIGMYIPAVRLICFFKLKSFSPLHLLEKEITNLRTQSKVDVEDGWRLRQMLELMAEYKLEIDIPGELLVKFMDLKTTLRGLG
ncbi:PREDICTED: uncharacterized protein LOC104764136 [Camelina sativa]|uniref:FRIGIDA-like protein n=1 Tax=Camelina sativa TaxID=90675 RepID=A0ABM0XH39_CAMSA|nr:PREDICTED: uncharacterized protein LOC104764136 [Camelina sativa]